ncbi:hypothetical protein COJ87_24610 [Bacillus cereus]|nr:hypothetical protein COM76_28680 [Bacillus cereus]PGA40424.1 hypothetical protein COL88_29600 [Bacillus thuringiensis]PEC81547.1 hypothetical protein CON08_00875 [Bacillus cereus]PET66017.1 hypothetical protein CN522_08370 [Bacillus cereus]PEX71230.1 hypothetical protein CN457_29585 [Bacillus cereus]
MLNLVLDEEMQPLCHLGEITSFLLQKKQIDSRIQNRVIVVIMIITIIIFNTYYQVLLTIIVQIIILITHTILIIQTTRL